jgi:hypothetical protein
MMAQSKPADEPSAPAFLDINQDLAFQRAEWSVQRLGWLSPNPVETRTGADRQVFAFAPIEGATSIVVGLEFRPKAAGMLSATMGIPNGGEVAFRQFVYP